MKTIKESPVQPDYKPIRMKTPKWQEIKDRADALAEERGGSVSLPDYISEASKFFEENRPKPEPR